MKDNRHAAQADTLQLWRGLPAVVAAPDDQLLLLGSPGVTILVDERPVQGDAVQYLRTLHGSDIERIEIITNPSAQYAAQGSGGIINIVLRRKRADGVSGSASAQPSSFGQGEASATVKTKHGKWTYEVQIRGTLGKFSESHFAKLRTVEQGDGTVSIDRATGEGSSTGATAYASGKAIYDISPRSTVSATVIGAFSHSRSDNDTDYVGLTPDFQSFTERQRTRNRSNLRRVEFAFDHKGKVEGEALSAGAFLARVLYVPHIIGRFDDGGGYDSDQDFRLLAGNAKIDWVHPIGKKQILSVGIDVDSWAPGWRQSPPALEALCGIVGLGTPFASRAAGSPRPAAPRDRPHTRPSPPARSATRPGPGAPAAG